MATAKRPHFQKRHYEDLARVVGTAYDDGSSSVLDALISLFVHDSPHFDSVRFREAVSRAREELIDNAQGVQEDASHDRTL